MGEHSSSFIFESIILILADNEDMHESLDQFKFRPDTDTNTRVICPGASEKLLYNVVSALAPLFLIGSSSYLQVIVRLSLLRKTILIPEYLVFMCVCVFVDGCISQF